MGEPGARLRKPHWDLSRLPKFEKNFYSELPTVGSRSQVLVIFLALFVLRSCIFVAKFSGRLARSGFAGRKETNMTRLTCSMRTCDRPKSTSTDGITTSQCREQKFRNPA